MSMNGSPSARELAFVAVGGAVGAAARWALIEATAGSDGGVAGPVLLANVVGCAVLGLLLGRGVAGSARLLLGVGLCGGLTTFSTFAVEVADALRTDDLPGAIGYTVLSVVGGLCAFVLGRQTGRATTKAPSC
ncbi:MAG: CrcB family protein [Actinomycetota bacterium]|nr:CrcB family protein [Actinomycetota bacterium]MED6327975.1 CrcB family protein [Actinomycetota bacterium]